MGALSSMSNPIGHRPAEIGAWPLLDVDQTAETRSAAGPRPGKARAGGKRGVGRPLPQWRGGGVGARGGKALRVEVQVTILPNLLVCEAADVRRQTDWPTIGRRPVGRRAHCAGPRLCVAAGLRGKSGKRMRRGRARADERTSLRSKWQVLAGRCGAARERPRGQRRAFPAQCLRLKHWLGRGTAAVQPP